MRLRAYLIIITELGACFFGPQHAHAQQTDFYVAVNGNDHAMGTLTHPVRTLHRVQQLARMARKDQPTAPVNVFLREGTYYLDSALVFTAADNTTADGALTYQAYLHEKVVLSGGRRLRVKWTAWEKGIYQARISAGFDFDQLFVNGRRQVRARYPNDQAEDPIFNGVSKMALSPEKINSWHQPAGGYIHALQKAHWGSLSYRITGKNNTGDLQLEGGYQINRSHQIDSNMVFVENIREELDSAHEWYLDRSTHILYYKPPPGLDLQHAKIEVPVLLELIIFSGNGTHPVSRIHFDDITMTHTRQTFMLTREPLLRGDWNIFRGGAVLLSGTEHCRFSQCGFESPGGNALFFSNYNRYDTVEHCLIRDAGASGICFVGDPLAVRSPSFNYDQYVAYGQMDPQPGPRTDNFPQHCRVYDNLIYRTGRIEKQTAGIHISMSMDIDIVQNTIYHVPRAGININDGTWGGHHIENNDVFETVLETGDHGAFNSWGRDRYWSPDRSYMDSLVAMHPELVKLDALHPVIIRHNRFRCDHGWDIDLDDGSTNYIIDSNLCLNGGIKLREGFYRQVVNNLMVNNTFHPHVWFKDSHVSFMHNIVMRPYAPIQIISWGDSIDHNFFGDTTALLKARTEGTDRHSVAASLFFRDPSKGDYTVRNRMIQAAGFRNFDMQNFGVVSPRLKAIAKHPEFPPPVIEPSLRKNEQYVEWKGATLKNVGNQNEQSALGQSQITGIYVVSLSVESSAYKMGLRKNDVILQAGVLKIRNINDFKDAFKKNATTKTMDMEISRNQKEKRLQLSWSE